MAKEMGARFRVANVLSMYQNEYENAVFLNISQCSRDLVNLFEQELKENHKDYMQTTKGFMTDSMEYSLRVTILNENEYLELLMAKRELDQIKKVRKELKGKERP